MPLRQNLNTFFMPKWHENRSIAELLIDYIGQCVPLHTNIDYETGRSFFHSHDHDLAENNGGKSKI